MKKLTESVRDSLNLLSEAASMEEVYDAIELLETIQERIFEAREMLHDTIRAYIPDKLAYWESYGLAQLAIIAGDDSYMSADESISSLIKELQEEATGSEDEFGEMVDTGEAIVEEEPLEEAHMVLAMRPVATDDQVYDRLSKLKQAGIDAQSGSRSAKTDIIINSKDRDRALEILQKAGYNLG
jgi:hypothetical protein